MECRCIIRKDPLIPKTVRFVYKYKDGNTKTASFKIKKKYVGDNWVHYEVPFDFPKEMLKVIFGEDVEWIRI